MKTKFNKFTALVLTLMLIITLVPASVMAEVATYSIFDAEIPFDKVYDCQQGSGDGQQKPYRFEYPFVGNDDLNEVVPDVEENPGNYYYKLEKNGEEIKLVLYSIVDETFSQTVYEGGYIKTYGEGCFLHISDTFYGTFISLRSDKTYHLDDDTEAGCTNPGFSDRYNCNCAAIYTIEGENPDFTTLEALTLTENLIDIPHTCVYDDVTEKCVCGAEKPETYTISFSANGGEGVMADQAVNCGVATALSENTFTRDEYEFIGWATSSGAAEAEFNNAEEVTDLAAADGTITLYAVWKSIYKEYFVNTKVYDDVADVFEGVAEVTEDNAVIKIKLTSDIYGRICFDNNDGKFVVDLNGKTVTPGNKNEAICLDNNFDGVVTLTGSGTLKKGRNNVTFVGDGELIFALEEGKDYFTVKNGGESVLDNEKNFSDVPFRRWMTSGYDEFVFTQYKYTYYTVNFNANGGEGTMEEITVKEGEEVTLTENAFTMDGYTFIGWATSSDAAEAEFEDKETVTLTGDLNLYAIWEKEAAPAPKPRTSSGGSAKYFNVVVNYGDDVFDTFRVRKGNYISLEGEPQKEGFIFEGYYADPEFENEYDFTTPVTSSKTVYVKWAEAEKEVQDGNETESGDNHECYSKAFKDIDADEWCHSYTDFVTGKGLMTGVEEDMFVPDGKVTRGMILTVLYRLDGETEVINRSIPFKDLDLSAYYANAVIWAQQNGIIKGIGNGKVMADDSVTREQLAAILQRYYNFKGEDIENRENATIFGYSDFSKISEYAISSLQWAVSRGVLEGKSKNTLNPRDCVTRAELAAILTRIVK